MGQTFSTDSAWKPVKVGAGGWLVGIDVALDGTKVVRTDTYGAYVWNGTGWTQMVTAASMPDTARTYAQSVYEVRVAPNNSNVMYMHMTDGLYKTIDRGESWTKTSLTLSGFTSVEYRADGQRLAIDPTNSNIVFVGTQKDGLFVTRDGGTSWQKIAGVAPGTSDLGMSGITIEGSNVYVGTAGSGVYKSSDGGHTWSSIGGPSDVGHAVLTKSGTYLASESGTGALWKYSGGSWTKVIEKDVHAVALDPFDQNHIVVTTGGGSLQESRDGGSNWSGWQWTTKLEASDDIPWLEDSGLYMSTGGIVFDPQVQGKLWQSAGVGVWETQLPTGKWDWSTTVTWNSRSMGIEQLVANDIVASAGINPVFSSWDRAFFEMGDLDSYASTYSGGKFSMGWSVDYASSSPTFLVGISDWWGTTENSGFSADGGKTWQKFEGLPSWAMNSVGGSIAASTPQNFIWVASGNQPPAYTLDGGKTWTNISIPGISNWQEVHRDYHLARTTITADRVQANTFYLYDTTSGVYRTTDGGASWTKMYSGEVGSWTWWNVKMEAVPGSAGELYFTSGPMGSDPTVFDALPLMHSTDGGASWTALTDVKVNTFGYGAAASPGGPATVFIVGSVKGDYGIWYSDDESKTWNKIGEHPMGSLDVIKTISGDMDNFGMVYVGFGGSGFAYYDFHTGGTTTPPPPAPDTKPAAPNQVVVIDAALDDVGTPASVSSGSTVNDSTPTLTGTLSAALGTGQKVAVFRDGQLLGYAESTTTKWTFADPGAGDGKHDYVVRVVDALGQQGAASGAFSLSVDTLAPTQAISVTGVTPADNSSTLAALSTMKMSLDASTGSTVITGTIAGTLGADESVIVFRDGVKIGTASVNFGNWSFGDAVNSGSVTYTAQIHDAAGNTGKMSNVLTVSFGSNEIFGTFKDDALVGSSGADRISGVPQDGGKLGKSSIDVLTGAGGDDVFILGDSRGRFYDDYNVRLAGRDDYARITDFDEGDKLQLLGSAKEYLQGHIENLGGFSGTGIYHDSNGNGVIDHRDDLIALVQNHGPIDLSGFIFV